MNKRKLFLVFCIAQMFLINGCATVPRCKVEVFERLYEQQRLYLERNPVIFIPGVLGSILKDQQTGLVVWGRNYGRFSQVLSLPISALTLFENRDNLVSLRPLDRFSCIPGIVQMEVYERDFRIITNVGGYVANEDIFEFSYDWRRDFVESAQQLANLIEHIKHSSGQPDIKINLLCHSAGGLIARYYAKYGGVDVLEQDPLPPPTYAGASNINKIIMLGTPNSGLLEPFKRIHNGISIIPIVYLSPEILFTMPSLYELLPHNGKDIFVNRDGVILEVDIYDPANWEKYGWSVFCPRRQERIYKKFSRVYGKDKGEDLYKENLAKQRRFLATALKRAKRFHEALWQGEPDEERQRVTYVLLGSNCQPTLRRVLLEQKEGVWKTEFKARRRNIRNLLYSFGDGVVTKESLLGIHYVQSAPAQPNISRLPSAYEVFVYEKHGNLMQNPTYMNNVFHALFDQK